MSGPDTHPSGEQLPAFSLGQLDGGLLSAVEGHLAACPECQALAAAAPDDRLVGQLRAAHARGVRHGDTVRDARDATLSEPLPADSSQTAALPSARTIPCRLLEGHVAGEALMRRLFIHAGRLQVAATAG
jgi:hypothetical protein